MDHRQLILAVLLCCLPPTAGRRKREKATLRFSDCGSFCRNSRAQVSKEPLESGFIEVASVPEIGYVTSQSSVNNDNYCSPTQSQSSVNNDNLLPHPVTELCEQRQPAPPSSHRAL
ncbi:hypothetical protein ACOMHN_026668 [Nucella lapillus]